MREIASQIDPVDCDRYAEIVKLLANTSPLLFGSEEARRYNKQIFEARGDLLAILRRAKPVAGDDRLTELIHHYEGRDER